MSIVNGVIKQIENGLVGFYCPGCDGMHIVRTQDAQGAGPRWTWNNDWNRPTFSPSIHVNPPDPKYHNPAAFTCHSFVRDGQIQFLGDCTHGLAGQTHPLPAWDYNEGESE